MTEEQALAEIFTEDLWALAEVGDGCDGFETVATYDGSTHRWYTVVYVVTKTPTGRLLRWDWMRGLTEMQENECYDQVPVEVELRNRQVTITEYVAI